MENENSNLRPLLELKPFERYGSIQSMTGKGSPSHEIALRCRQPATIAPATRSITLAAAAATAGQVGNTLRTTQAAVLSHQHMCAGRLHVRKLQQRHNDGAGIWSSPTLLSVCHSAAEI